MEVYKIESDSIRLDIPLFRIKK